MSFKNDNKIILNEPMFAEYILGATKSTRVNTSIYSTLDIVARYLYQRGGVKKTSELIKRLSNVAQKLDKDSNLKKWDCSIKKIISRKNLNRQLIEILYVPVTKTELDVIDSLDGILLQKTVFSLLCLAKFRNMYNPSNDNWENFDISFVFNRANVVLSQNRKYEIIHKLCNLGIVRVSSMVLNTSIRVNFIDDTSPEVLRVGDFRCLGNIYLRYKGIQIDTCTVCGKLYEHKKQSKTLYCKSCKDSFRKTTSNNLYITIEERPILSECSLCGAPIYINPKMFWLNQICPNCEEEKTNLVLSNPTDRIK